MNDLDLTPAHREIIMDIARRYLAGFRVIAFGSRVQGRARPGSDLDLCIIGNNPLPDASRRHLMAEFDDALLPFRVDIVEWHDLPSSLQAQIDRDHIPLFPDHG